jgi:hypothetical protein
MRSGERLLFSGSVSKLGCLTILALFLVAEEAPDAIEILEMSLTNPKPE